MVAAAGRGGRLRPAFLYSVAVNAEFNWWLLIVGLVVGAGIVWFVVADMRRDEDEVDDAERPREALWLATVLEREGHAVTPDAAVRLLELHQAYLGAPPPDAAPVMAPDLAAASEALARADQAPLSTGSGPDDAPLASTSDTPNVAPWERPATTPDGPTQ